MKNSACKVSCINAVDMKHKGVQFAALVSDDNGMEHIQATMFGATYTRLVDDLKSDDEERNISAKADIVGILLCENGLGNSYLEISVD